MKALLNKLLCGVAILLLAPGLAFAQDGVVTGTVTDAETGDPLPGATVQISELGVGGATDVDGNFEFDVPEGTHDISASFVGYESMTKTIEVTAGETTAVDFAIAPSAQQLDEIVVSGYRVTGRSSSPTGATVSVSGAEIAELQAQTADRAFQGRLAGVRVTAATGEPGGEIQVRIRGTGSITAGSDPLYIIDGVQVPSESITSQASGNPLSALNPNDIQSVEVLKDVAAKSIYGAQAANGVVLITTKSGSSGQTRVNFSTQAGTNNLIKTQDVLSAREFSLLKAESLVNRTQGLYAGQIPYSSITTIEDAGNFLVATGQISENPANPDAEFLTTDWQDAIYETGITQKYDLSISGGNDQTRFFISGSFEDTDGQVPTSSFKRYAGRVNVDHEIRDGLSVESRLALTSVNQTGTITGGLFINSPVLAGSFQRPDLPIYNERGNPESGFNLDFPQANVFSENTLAAIELNEEFSNNNQFIGSTALNWSILDNLNSRSYAGLSYQDTDDFDYRSPVLPGNQATNGSKTVVTDRATSLNVSQSLTFDDRFVDDQHGFTGILGGEYRRVIEEGSDASGQNFPSRFFQNLDSAGEPVGIGEFETQYTQLSTFASADYDFDNRYLIGATVRIDGSSRFGENNRYGTFGSASAGWVISQESFFDVGFIQELKLRGSYGVTGNNAIDNFESRQLYQGNTQYLGPAIQAVSLGNPNLTWEEEQQINVGLDFNMFSGRLRGAFNVYDTRNEELLFDRQIPLETGFASITENIGEVKNQGIEIQLSTVNLDVGGFRWDTDFNISFQRNEVLSLPGEEDRIIDVEDPASEDVFQITEGESLFENYFPEYAGVNPADGRPMWYDADGDITYAPTPNVDDKFLGNQLSDFFGGFGNSFQYKGVSLDVFFQFDYGRDVYNTNRALSDNSAGPAWNQVRFTLDRWQQPGDVTDIPVPINNNVRPTSDPDNINSSRYIEDASYIRLKQVRLGYDLPNSVIDAARMRNATIFVQGTNLITWTEYTGLDPEIVGDGAGRFPQSRSYTAGIQLGF